MKTLKILCILFLSAAIISCSKKDDDGGGSAPEASFNATINGGSFGSNYSSRLGFYSTTTANGITIAVTDQNQNIIRFFLNETGGFDTVIKEIGNVDDNGFVTNVIIRDQEAMITYNSSEGQIVISENKSNPEIEGGRLISGNFDITAVVNTGETITMTGTFKNIAY
ncbi:hypothetical protein LS48_00075 [Aequorivita aquimaris]|uniref:Uncharacterized protein n=1 Tax=Aequorivita aquimaris TaxID=1548749 RepID=A0A137RL38_9FLAO|nr:hypothetical protein [Aequorivita aquimaris]KXO00920.1 hypothetical protein LS48_00075 [Aequorivita aquimaris]